MARTISQVSRNLHEVNCRNNKGRHARTTVLDFLVGAQTTSADISVLAELLVPQSELRADKESQRKAANARRSAVS